LGLLGISKNLLRVSIAALGGARNPHIAACTFRFLRSVRLALEPLITLFRDALLFETIMRGEIIGVKRFQE